MSRLITTMLFIGAAGCATSQSFQPIAKADQEMVAEGHRLGEVVVRSDGAREEKIAGDERTVVHVGFLVENATDAPLQIDPGALMLQIEGRLLTISQPIDVRGDRLIPAEGKGELALYYALPKGVVPRDVDAFRLDWSASAGSLTYAQRTPFSVSDSSPFRWRSPHGYSHSPNFEPLARR